ncbi:aldo/keto reductase [Rhodobacterales bacterium 52_120_T64]|nr:aldo/keto reductase [Rhodobacterales bacterium 52_120_T64]
MAPTPLIANDGTRASKFSFGTMQFGGKADKDESRRLYDASRTAGINFFDTAYVYTEGLSEQYLGEFAASERDSLIIASKCSSVGGSSSATIRAQLDKSRKRLNMDMIDVFYLHKWDDDTPLEESFSALAELRETGLFRHIGVSNFSAWQTMKAASVAEKLGVTIDILQPMYNLVKRQAEVEILPMAISEGFHVAPYSPLGGGLLTGKYAVGAGGRLADDKMYKARYGVDWMHDTATNLSELASEVGVHPATLAVSWVARNPGITHPIISARSVEQFEPSLNGISYELSDDLYNQITALSPQPAPATDRLEEA